MKSLLLFLALIATYSASADPIADLINAESESAPAAPVAAANLAQQEISKSIANSLKCFGAMAQAGLTSTNPEYKFINGEHFVFRKNLADNGRGFMHASAKGLYWCPLNFPIKEDGKRAFSFVLNGQTIQPYEAGGPMVEDVTSRCMAAPNLSFNLENQVAENIKNFGARPGATKGQIRNSCKWHQNFDVKFNEGVAEGKTAPAAAPQDTPSAQ